MLASEARERVLGSNTVTRTVDHITAEITQACAKGHTTLHSQKTSRMYFRNVTAVMDAFKHRGYHVEENIDKSITISWE